MNLKHSCLMSSSRTHRTRPLLQQTGMPRQLCPTADAQLHAAANAAATSCDHHGGIHFELGIERRTFTHRYLICCIKYGQNSELPFHPPADPLEGTVEMSTFTRRNTPETHLLPFRQFFMPGHRSICCTPTVRLVPGPWKWAWFATGA